MTWSKAAVNRLQSIARIGKRPVHDCGQCIGKVALFQRILQVDFLNALGVLGRGNVLAIIRAIQHRTGR